MPARHRILPHTADVALEAWAPDQESCVAEAVRALVETFADAATAIPRQTEAVRFDEADGEELLVRVLEEVIYQEEVHGWVPVDVSVRDREARFAVVPVTEVSAAGSVPKAISRHELRFGRAEDGLWHCHVIVDI